MSARRERGSAVVDFVLVLIVLVPLVLGVLQVALVMYVRNTLTAAASEGARYAAALGMPPQGGVARARQQLADVSSGSFVDQVTATRTTIGGSRAIAVTITARVPALGLAGPAVGLTVTGHATGEDQ